MLARVPSRRRRGTAAVDPLRCCAFTRISLLLSHVTDLAHLPRLRLAPLLTGAAPGPAHDEPAPALGRRPWLAMGGSEVLSLLLVLSVRESVLALCGGRTVGVDASILLYQYLLRAPGAAAALINGDPSLAVAAFKEVLNWMHKLPISWIFVFDGSCEGKAELSLRRERKRNEAYTTFMTDKFVAKAAAKAATRTSELELSLVNACLECGQAFLVAPEEADTQLAAMAHDGRVYAVLSEDADLLVMGVQRLLCKMSLRTTCWHFYDLASADWDLVRKQMEGAGQQQTTVTANCISPTSAKTRSACHCSVHSRAATMTRGVSRMWVRWRRRRSRRTYI